MVILIADSGSTKTDWRLSRNGKISQFSTEGLNPYFTSAERLQEILHAGFDAELKENGKTIDEIFFYGSGCAAEAGRSMMEKGLRDYFGTGAVEVNHDLLGAARGLCGHDAGMAAILGTGSNSCVYDGKEITHQQVSLGYILGDEGSGAYIGKIFLRDVLYGDAPEGVTKRFFDRFSLDRDAIVQRIYREPNANRFAASFCKFIYQQLPDQYCVDLVADAFRAFFTAHILRFPSSREMPLHITGSVGFYFSNILRRVAEEQQIIIGKIVESPVAGIMLYHLGE